MNKSHWLDLLVVLLVILTVVVFGVRKLKSYVNSSIEKSLVGVSEELSNINAGMLSFEEDVLSLKSSISSPVVSVSAIDSTVAAASNAVINSGAININTANLNQLMDLPGIGQSYATRIIEGRPYSSVDELTKVKGIGSKTLESIRNQIVAN